MLDDLNELIDDVAKEMTSAPGDANLAKRVGARTEEVAIRSATFWTRPVLLAPIALACTIAVAIFIARDRRAIAPRSVAPPIVEITREPAARVAPVEDAPQSQTARRAVPRRRVTPLLVVRDIAVAPIVVDRVDVAPIVRAEQIEIDPIAITRIEIPPMP